MICFACAGLLAALSVFLFIGHPLGTSAGWILVAFGAMLLYGGIEAHQIDNEFHEQLRQKQYKVDLLLAEQEEHQHAIDNLADGIDVGLFICDNRAAILYANRRARDFFEFEGLIGKTLLAVTLSYDLEQVVMEVIQTGQAVTTELNFTHPTEHIGIVKAWPHKEAGRVFVSIYEITQLRRLERARKDFVSNVSHELRTPLTNIRTMAETLVDELDTTQEKPERYLKKIINEVDRLSMMSNDLLILSAAESNPIRKQNCDLADLMRGVVQQLQHLAEDKNLSLTFSGPEHLSVPINPAQMTQVAINLIENGLNYTQEGDVRVSVRSEENQAIVEVEDTGTGIASEEIPRIFERFYRADKGRSRTSGGTGLGLSIVKHIVEAHGGSVEVDSELHEGSRFIVMLPLEQGS